MAKWGTILGTLNLNYLPQITNKGQVLADLVVEFTEGVEGGENKERDRVGKEIGIGIGIVRMVQGLGLGLSWSPQSTSPTRDPWD